MFRSTRSIRPCSKLTRRDRCRRCWKGSQRPRRRGCKVKLNTVALKGLNEDELPDLIAWAHGQRHDVTLIETMPLGEVDGERIDHYLPLGGGAGAIWKSDGR